MHRFILLIFVLIVNVSAAFAASDAARVAGDLKINGIHFSKDGSTMDSANNMLRNKGAWSSGTLYSAGDVVQSLSGSYVCTTANVNITPPNASYWGVLGTQGLQGVKGDKGDNCTISLTAICDAISTKNSSLPSFCDFSPPLAPSGLNATATYSSQIALTWTDNSINETGFKIERKAGFGGLYSQITTTLSNVVGYIDTGLSASTTYYYRIRSTNNIGDSGYASEVNTTTLENVGNGGTGTVQLPKTGQTACNDVNGAIINCTESGQDGELQMGIAWPTPRFMDNSLIIPTSQTVTDQLTGLMWVKDGNLMKTRDAGFDMDTGSGEGIGDGRVTWLNALDYVKKLNAESYLGYNDWRLPNSNELQNLLNAKDQNNWNAWLDAYGFSNSQDRYWSSSSSVATPTAAVIVDNNNVSYKNKSFRFFVWPVRSGQQGIVKLPKTGQTSCYDATGKLRYCLGTGEDGEIQAGTAWPSPRFIDNSISTAADLTVTDNLTGLIWTKDGLLAGGTWQKALDYIKTLNISSYLGHNDWRLPNINELESLANKQQPDQSIWLNTQGFKNVQSFSYWSSTPKFTGGTGYVLGLDMIKGYQSGYDKNSYNLIWPVRGLN